MAGAEYPAGQLFYQLALTKADRSFVDDYQLYKNPVDFQADPLKYGADTFDDWVKKGYIAQGLGGAQGRGHGHRVHRRQVPDDRLRQLVVRPLHRRDQRLRLGHLPVPRQQLSPARPATSGSCPRHRKNKDLAYDFIDITMRPEIQDLLGNSGGIPVAGRPVEDHRPEEPGS